MSKSFDPLSSLNVGIGKIIGQDAVAGTERLPDSAPLVPMERRPQLQDQEQRKIWSPSLETNLLSSLCPHLEHRNVLFPSVIQELLSNVAQTLESLPDEETSAELREAAELLREDGKNKELLTMYRNALHKG